MVPFGSFVFVIFGFSLWGSDPTIKLKDVGSFE